MASKHDATKRSGGARAGGSPDGEPVDGAPAAESEAGAAGADAGGDVAADSDMGGKGTVDAVERAESDTQRALDEQRDKYLRLAAEFENYRRRATKERQEAGARAQADLARQLIDALDDIARFAHVDPTTVDAATVVQGVDMVEKKMLKALGGAGLQVVNPLDQPFDPAVHEAVATEPALSPEDDHMVARVYQPGYVFGSQLLRPARVVVKQWNG
jgi:molecular chaperone GrpE